MKEKLLRKIIHKYPAEDEPDGDVMGPHHAYIGAIVMWFSFQYVWPYQPTVGATGALLGTIITADDVVSHAFGISTPFDWLWHNVIRKLSFVR